MDGLEYLIPSLAMVALMAFLSGTAIYWVILHVRQRQRAQRANEEDAARQFERSALRSLENPGGRIGVDSMDAMDHGDGMDAMDHGDGDKTDGDGSVAPPLAAPSDPSVLPMAKGEVSCLGRGLPPEIQSALARLETAALLADSEGPLHLSADLPPAYQFRLKDGKRLLVLPARTPPEVIAAQSRMVDYLLVTPENQSALICQSLSDFIASHLFPD